MRAIEVIRVRQPKPHSARKTVLLDQIEIGILHNRRACLNPIVSSNEIQLRLLAGRRMLLLIRDQLSVTVTSESDELNQAVSRRQHRNDRIEMSVVELEIVHQLTHVLIARNLRADHRHRILQTAALYSLLRQST